MQSLYCRRVNWYCTTEQILWKIDRVLRIRFPAEEEEEGERVGSPYNYSKSRFLRLDDRNDGRVASSLCQRVIDMYLYLIWRLHFVCPSLVPYRRREAPQPGGYSSVAVVLVSIIDSFQLWCLASSYSLPQPLHWWMHSCGSADPEFIIGGRGILPLPRYSAPSTFIWYRRWLFLSLSAQLSEPFLLIASVPASTTTTLLCKWGGRLNPFLSRLLRCFFAAGRSCQTTNLIDVAGHVHSSSTDLLVECPLPSQRWMLLNSIRVQSSATPKTAVCSHHNKKPNNSRRVPFKKK